jgi:hypothetical protein
MSWKRQTFEPYRPPPRYVDRCRFPSPPLCRLCGAIGFTAGGLVVFYGATALLGVERDFMGAGEWGFKEIAALGGSLLAGILCGLLAFGLGASVEVRSENRNHVFAVMWHYLANGSIIWFLLLALVLTKALGQAGTKQLFDQLGSLYSTFAIVVTGAVGSLTFAGVLLLTGQVKYKRKPKLFPCFLLTLPVSIVMGYVQFWLLGVSTGFWLIISVIFPLALVPFSAIMVSRDFRQRRDLLSMLKE